jgi:hypothetical protein
VVDQVLGVIGLKLQDRVRKHGPGAYAGPHETLGILVEEMHELTESVRANRNDQTVDELVDVAVGAIFGVASLITLGRDGDRGNRWGIQHG